MSNARAERTCSARPLTGGLCHKRNRTYLRRRLAIHSQCNKPGRSGMSHLQECSQEPVAVYLPRWVERPADLGIESTDPQLVRRQRLTNIFAYGTSTSAASRSIVVAPQEFVRFSRRLDPPVAAQDCNSVEARRCSQSVGRMESTMSKADLVNRHRNHDGEISHKHENTIISTLRKIMERVSPLGILKPRH
jgi:hypothetical protein